MKKRKLDQEYTKVDKLKHENKKLKKEVSRLRKILDRIDYEHLAEAAVYHEITGKKLKVESNKKAKGKVCYKCGQAEMRLIIFGNRHLWKCDCCDNRTKTKVNESVKESG